MWRATHYRSAGMWRMLVLFLLLASRTGEADSVAESNEEPLVLWREGAFEIIDGDRLQEAFESYLKEPSVAEAPVNVRRDALEEASGLLITGAGNTEHLAKAYALLQRLAVDSLDEGRCHSLLTAILRISSALEKKESRGASEAALRKEQEILSWNAGIDKLQKSAGFAVSKASTNGTSPSNRLAEVMAEISRMELGAEVSELQAKLELQSLALRFLVRGDYPEAILAARFYRAIFGDQEMLLRLGPEEKLEVAPEGSQPTMNTIEQLATRASMTLEQAISQSSTLLKSHASLSAAKLLSSAYAQAPHSLPLVSFSEEGKNIIRGALEGEKHLHELMATNDLDAALEELDLLEKASSDFADSEFRASIVASKSLALVHLAAARAARDAGATEKLFAELKLSTDLWPKNPELIEFVKEVSSNAELQSKTIEEFDQLVQSHRVMEIARKGGRFEQAFADLPARREELQHMLDEADKITAALRGIQELHDHHQLLEAWEQAEVLRREYPEETSVQQLASSMEAQAKHIAEPFRAAKEEERQQPVQALLLYFKFRQHYPQSLFVREGIERCAKILLGN